MKPRLGFIALAVLVLTVGLLPRLVRRMDGTLAASQEKAAAIQALYRDMTNAYPIAAEMPSNHPVHRRWRECREKLLEARYLETRELPMQDRLAAKGATWAFFKAFQARFPGVECAIRGAKSDQAVAIITAPKAEFGLVGDIELFVRHYQYEPGK